MAISLRIQVALALVCLGAAACQTTPELIGRDTQTINGSLDRLNPTDVAVAPVRYGTTGVSAPAGMLRRAAQIGLTRAATAPSPCPSWTRAWTRPPLLGRGRRRDPGERPRGQLRGRGPGGGRRPGDHRPFLGQPLLGRPPSPRRRGRGPDDRPGGPLRPASLGRAAGQDGRRLRCRRPGRLGPAGHGVRLRQDLRRALRGDAPQGHRAGHRARRDR